MQEKGTKNMDWFFELILMDIVLNICTDTFMYN